MPIDPLHAPVPHLLLEVAHVAHRLSTSQEYVRQLLRTRKLAGVRLGRRWRIDAGDLKRWIDAQRVAIAAEERVVDALLSTATQRAAAIARTKGAA